MIEQLPKDLSRLGKDGIRRAIALRDERVSALFGRWPYALSAFELRELRRLHDERQRLARFVGRGRRRGEPV